MVLACWASYDKKTLVQQVIPLALGYWTALLLRPANKTRGVVKVNLETLRRHLKVKKCCDLSYQKM